MKNDRGQEAFSLAFAWRLPRIPLLLAVAFAILSQAPVPARPEDWAGDAGPSDSERIERGRILFGRGCGNDFCHGLNGEGHPVLSDARKLNDGVWKYSDGSYAGIIRVVMEGLPGSPMEPWAGRWGIEKVRDVAAFVLTLSEAK